MRIFSFIISALLLLPFGFSYAQEEPDVPVDFIFSHEGYAPGDSGGLAVVFDVPGRYHITNIDLGLFYVEIKPHDGFSFSSPVFPEPVDFEGDAVYQGVSPVIIDFVVDEDTPAVKYKIDVSYGYQLCSETGARICYLPHMKDTTLTVTVLEVGTSQIPIESGYFAGSTTVSGAAQPDVSSGSLESRFTNALNEGSILAFLLVFIAGILTSFTPCVYPVIPITVGFIGGKADGKKLSGFFLSIFLVLGLATIYSVLGVIAAATGSVFGSYAQHPVVLIVIAGIFLAMGASMFGLFEISVPASIQGKMQTQKKGFLGAYLVGLVTGIVAAPCVGPVLVALLTWVAQTGNTVLGFFLLFTFAIGMGLLFIVIGTFAGAVSALPGSGSWMETVKKGFGILLVAGALFFLRPLLSIHLYHLLWGILLVGTGVLMGALNFTAEANKWGKTIGLILLTAGLLFFIDGFRTSFHLLPKSVTYGVVEPGSGEQIEWVVNDLDKAFDRAGMQDKLVLMDFYADWCAACRELEEYTWTDPGFIAGSGNFVFLKIDLTKSTPELKAIQNQYGVRGLPTVIFFDAGRNELDRFSGFRNADEVLEYIDNL